MILEVEVIVSSNGHVSHDTSPKQNSTVTEVITGKYLCATDN